MIRMPTLASINASSPAFTTALLAVPRDERLGALLTLTLGLAEEAGQLDEMIELLQRFARSNDARATIAELVRNLHRF